MRWSTVFKEKKHLDIPIQNDIFCHFLTRILCVESYDVLENKVRNSFLQSQLFDWWRILQHSIGSKLEVRLTRLLKAINCVDWHVSLKRGSSRTPIKSAEVNFFKVFFSLNERSYREAYKSKRLGFPDVLVKKWRA